MKHRIPLYLTSKNKSKVVGMLKENETVSDVINMMISKYGNKK